MTLKRIELTLRNPDTGAIQTATVDISGTAELPDRVINEFRNVLQRSFNNVHYSRLIDLHGSTNVTSSSNHT
ncbi:MAG: hypothetical protein ACTHLZ_17825 [Tepidisphaeraceae bacterium]